MTYIELFEVDHRKVVITKHPDRESLVIDVTSTNPFDEDHPEIFSASFTWRGVWEGRVYFPDDNEFWGTDLKEMADLWDNHIVPRCKGWFIRRDPELERYREEEQV